MRLRSMIYRVRQLHHNTLTSCMRYKRGITVALAPILDWGTFVVIAIGSVIVMFSSGKNISCILYMITLVCISAGVISARHVWKPVAIGLFALSVLAMASPLDVDVRASDDFRVAVLPVVYNLESSGQVRRAKQAGLREGIDFIVVSRQPLFNDIHSSIVIFVPM